MARRWTPGLLSKLFFGGTWILEVTPEGLQIDGHSYSWSSLTRCEGAPAFFWGHLRVAQGEQDLVLRGMSCAPGNDFPSTRQDDPLLSLFMPIADALPFAEERRLFYVAMTRARRACVLMVPKFGASPFVTEVLETRFQESVRSLEISQDEESEVPDPLTAAMQQVCPECRRGRLLPRTGANGPFMVCERKDRGFSHCRNIQGHVPPGQSTQFRKAPRSPKRAGPG